MSRNYHAYRQSFEEGIWDGGIPNLAITLKDLFQLEEIPDQVEGKEDKLNFHKFSKQWRSLTNLLRCQRLSKYEENIKSNAEIKKILADDFAVITGEEEERLWELSYRIKPRGGNKSGS